MKISYLHIGNDLSDNQLLILENIKINSKISASKLSQAIGKIIFLPDRL